MRLLVIGDLNLDVRAPLPRPARAGGESRGAVRAEPGGSAATFARHAARRGAQVRFVGCVGDDPIGEMLIASLVAEGVEPRVSRSALPTGVVVALWEGGERTMICSRGANDGLTREAVSAAILGDADHLHLSGYALLSPAQRPVALRAIELARSAGRTVSVDPPPASLIEAAGVARVQRDLDGVDWLTPNLEEGRLLTGQTAHKRVVDRLASRFSAGALTLGEGGAMVWRGRDRCISPPPTVMRTDPTGAGDAFAAAFVVGLLAGGPLAPIAERAVEAAAAHLAERGA
jgi:ribokinase